MPLCALIEAYLADRDTRPWDMAPKTDSTLQFLLCTFVPDLAYCTPFMSKRVLVSSSVNENHVLRVDVLLVELLDLAVPVRLSGVRNCTCFRSKYLGSTARSTQDLHVDFWEVQRGALLAKKKIDGVLKE